MFTTKKYQPYQPVPHHDDEEDDNDLDDGHCKISDLLKLTAHRRIIQRKLNDGNDSDKSHDSDHSHHSGPCDLDLEEIHLDDETEYDLSVLLLYLDGNKRKVSVMNDWKIYEFKEKYFGNELKNGNNVRLIYRGKLLDDSLAINVYNIPNDAFIHVSMTKNGTLQHCNKQSTNTEDANYDNFDDGIDDAALARTLQQREMRMIGMPMSMSMSQATNDNDDDVVIDPNRARREFLCGIFLGSVAGIWILIFLILAPRQYSRRFRLGVTLGVVINVMIQLSYGQPPTNDVDDANDTNTINETDPSESVNESQ
eukprot:543029_1